MAEVLRTGTLPENVNPLTGVLPVESRRELPASRAESLARTIARRMGLRVRQVRSGLRSLRPILRRQATEIRNWQPEHPLKVALRCAGAAFLAGVALRVWRSSNE